MTLEALLIAELAELYDGEHQLLDAAGRLAQSARGEALRSALTSHLEETRGHLTRLQSAFSLLNRPAERVPSPAMAGILASSQRVLSVEEIDGAVLDAGVIACAQKIEHLEICGYGTCAAWARTLGLDPVAALLEETLVEERAADQALTDLAVQEVNISATHEAS